jgi:hypothetical protein
VRPLPITPRGPRLYRKPTPRILLACPRIAPDFEFDLLMALTRPKPFRRERIAHRTGEQSWPADTDTILNAITQTARDRLETAVNFIQPPAGEYHVMADFPRAQIHAARAIALLLSHRLPDHWFVVDRLFVKSRVFFRRRFGYKLQLVEANNIHLPRAIRAAIKGDFT